MLEPGSTARLTPREEEIVRLIAGGMLRKNVAVTLGISPKTVDVHLWNAASKLPGRGMPIVRIFRWVYCSESTERAA